MNNKSIAEIAKLAVTSDNPALPIGYIPTSSQDISTKDYVDTEIAGVPAGISTYLELTDTPASFGTAGQVAAVNATGDAIEFTDQATAPEPVVHKGTTVPDAGMGATGDKYLRTYTATETVTASLTSEYDTSMTSYAWTEDTDPSWGYDNPLGTRTGDEIPIMWTEVYDGDTSMYFSFTDRQDRPNGTVVQLGDVTFTVDNANNRGGSAPGEYYYYFDNTSPGFASTQTAMVNGTPYTVSLSDEVEKFEEYNKTSGGWQKITNIGDAPSDTLQYSRQDGEWTEVAAGGVEEAPQDTKQYARQDSAWTEIVAGGVAEGSVGVITKPTTTAVVPVMETLPIGAINVGVVGAKDNGDVDALGRTVIVGRDGGGSNLSLYVAENGGETIVASWMNFRGGAGNHYVSTMCGADANIIWISVGINDGTGGYEFWEANITGGTINLLHTVDKATFVALGWANAVTLGFLTWSAYNPVDDIIYVVGRFDSVIGTWVATFNRSTGALIKVSENSSTYGDPYFLAIADNTLVFGGTNNAQGDNNRIYFLETDGTYIGYTQNYSFGDKVLSGYAVGDQVYAIKYDFSNPRIIQVNVPMYQSQEIFTPPVGNKYLLPMSGYVTTYNHGTSTNYRWRWEGVTEYYNFYETLNNQYLTRENAPDSTALGVGIDISTDGGVAVGNYPVGGTGKMFEVGIGTPGVLESGLVVETTGQVKAPGAALLEIIDADALVTKEYVTANTLPEAPVDTKQYARQDAGWTEVVAGGGTSATVYYDVGRTGDPAIQAVLDEIRAGSATYHEITLHADLGDVTLGSGGMLPGYDRTLYNKHITFTEGTGAVVLIFVQIMQMDNSVMHFDNLNVTFNGADGVVLTANKGSTISFYDCHNTIVSSELLATSGSSIILESTDTTTQTDVAYVAKEGSTILFKGDCVSDYVEPSGFIPGTVVLFWLYDSTLRALRLYPEDSTIDFTVQDIDMFVNADTGSDVDLGAALIVNVQANFTKTLTIIGGVGYNFTALYDSSKYTGVHEIFPSGFPANMNGGFNGGMNIWDAAGTFEFLPSVIDAPSDTKSYVRKDGAWEEASGITRVWTDGDAGDPQQIVNSWGPGLYMVRFVEGDITFTVPVHTLTVSVKTPYIAASAGNYFRVLYNADKFKTMHSVDGVVDDAFSADGAFTIDKLMDF